MAHFSSLNMERHSGFDDSTGIHWPLIECDRVAFKAHRLPSETMFDRSWFGHRFTFAFSNDGNEVDGGKIWELSKSGEKGKFLWMEELTEHNYEEILAWSLHNGYARPLVHWVPNYSEDDDQIQLKTGQATFCVMPSSKMHEEFGVPYSFEPVSSAQLIAFAYAHYVLLLDGICYYDDGSGFIFRERFQDWSAELVNRS